LWAPTAASISNGLLPLQLVKRMRTLYDACARDAPIQTVEYGACGDVGIATRKRVTDDRVGGLCPYSHS